MKPGDVHGSRRAARRPSLLTLDPRKHWEEVDDLEADPFEGPSAQSAPVEGLEGYGLRLRGAFAQEPRSSRALHMAGLVPGMSRVRCNEPLTNCRGGLNVEEGSRGGRWKDPPMREAPQVLTDVNALSGKNVLYPVRGVPVMVQAELRLQLETAVAFADYCVFLAAGAGSGQAAQIVDRAEALYVETMHVLRRQGMPE